MPRRSSDVWQYYQIIGDENNKKRVVCIYCNAEYKNAVATRLKFHLSTCSKCPAEVKNKFYTEKTSSKIPLPTTSLLRTDENVPTVESPLPSTSSSSCEINVPTCTSVNRNDSEPSSENIDAALARAVYASGVPLSIFESHYWKEVFHLLNSNYEVPSRYLLSISLENSLLDAEYERVKIDIGQKINDSVALALVVDGWSNILGKGVLNFIVTTPLPIFYKAVYPEERETAEYLSEQMINVISEIGEQKFVIIITDNASNMKAAWRLVKRRYPHISCVGCVAHSLNLIFSDILKMPIFADILKRVTTVIKYIKHTHLAQIHLEKFQHEKYGKIKCTLKLPSKTRWSGAVIMLNSYMQNREALEALAIAREFTTKKDIKDIILNENIWAQVDENLKILKPIADGILKSESDKCLLSEIPPLFESIKNNVASELETNTSISVNEKCLISASISKRRDFCLQPIHLAANLLDPRYRGSDLNDEEVITASDFISELATHLKQDVAAVLKNMCDFKNKKGHFGRSNTIWIAAKVTEPSLWWETFAHGQDIRLIATKILSVPSSSASSERNWSTFGKIHNKSRNRLSTARVSKLVSIFSNLRLRHGDRQMQHEESDDSSEISETQLNINNYDRPTSSSVENFSWEDNSNLLDMEVQEEDPLQE